MLSLRPGNIHAALGADDDLAYLVTRLRQAWPNVVLHFRGDCGFSVPAMYEVCEELRVGYTFGLSRPPGNPMEGAPNGLATRVSTPGRVRSSLRRARDRGASVSTRGLTRTRVTPSYDAKPSSAATDADSVVRSTTSTPPFRSKKPLLFISDGLAFLDETR